MKLKQLKKRGSQRGFKFMNAGGEGMLGSGGYMRKKKRLKIRPMQDGQKRGSGRSGSEKGSAGVKRPKITLDLNGEESALE